MKKSKSISPRNVTTLPWRLEIEFDDTPSCKLYSQLSFCDEDEELTAPPVSPVESYKYAALVKHNKPGRFTSTENIIDNTCQLYNTLDTYDKSSNKFIEDDAPGERISLPLNYRKPRKIEEFGFTEHCCATKSYSAEPVYLRSNVQDVNQDRKSKVRYNMSSSYMSNKSKIKNEAANSRATRSFSSKCCTEERLDNEYRKFSSSTVTNNNGKKYINPQTNFYTLYKQPKSTPNGSITEIHKIETPTKENDFLSKERDIASKIWQRELLANRSSKSCSFSILNDDETNCIRYRSEMHSFLRKANTYRNYKRTVRLRSSAMLLDSCASTPYS